MQHQIRTTYTSEADPQVAMRLHMRATEYMVARNPSRKFEFVNINFAESAITSTFEVDGEGEVV